MKKIFFFWLFLGGLAFFGGLAAYDLDYDQFVQRIEQNSIELIQNKGQFSANLHDYRAGMSWKNSFIETEIGLGKASAGKVNIESNTLVILTPRLPWVVAILNQSLQTKTIQYAKTYELRKRLAIIGAKRIYFSYVLAKEKYKIYQQREQNFYSQLKIIEKKFEAGSASKKDYVNFKNSYYDARLARIDIEKELENIKSILYKILGLRVTGDFLETQDINVAGLDFAYLKLQKIRLKEYISQSPYVEIIALSAKDHGINARASSMERWDNFEIGFGIESNALGNQTENFGSMRLNVPLPLTRRYDFLKKKYLALQSAALRENEVTRNNISVRATSLFTQLQTKREFIELQQENIKNKKSLVDMGKTAYESQRISSFEYLAYQNAYMDSLIKMIDAKMDYIQTQALLEETLGRVLQKGEI
ncbi:cadmium-zinc-nickel outer membrane efflux protein CznC [Helicobacter mustelae]|nr:TolC family protein [Helicobacter mustelae]SQH71532.1 cadmium-zinc-nickel outer membrane efflux protein CznC [Helicobacter mustelae]